MVDEIAERIQGYWKLTKRRFGRSAARRVQYLGDDGTNDLLAGTVLRNNEKQVWFLYEHLVSMPLVVAK